MCVFFYVYCSPTYTPTLCKAINMNPLAIFLIVSIHNTSISSCPIKHTSTMHTTYRHTTHTISTKLTTQTQQTYRKRQHTQPHTSHVYKTYTTTHNHTPQHTNHKTQHVAVKSTLHFSVRGWLEVMTSKSCVCMCFLGKHTYRINKFDDSDYICGGFTVIFDCLLLHGDCVFVCNQTLPKRGFCQKTASYITLLESCE